MPRSIQVSSRRVTGALTGGSFASFTGSVITSASLVTTGAASTFRVDYFETGGVPRFSLGANSTPETGSNVGSDFQIFRYDDTGSPIDEPITIRRSNGLVIIGDAMSVTGIGTFQSTFNANSTANFNSTTNLFGTVAGTHGQNVGTGDNPTFTGVTSTGLISASVSSGNAMTGIATTGHGGSFQSSGAPSSLLASNSGSGEAFSAGSVGGLAGHFTTGNVNIDNNLFISQLLTIGTSTGTGGTNTATSGQGAHISNATSTISITAYDLGGNCSIGTAFTIGCASDSRLKQKVVSIPSGLDKIHKTCVPYRSSTNLTVWTTSDSLPMKSSRSYHYWSLTIRPTLINT